MGSTKEDYMKVRSLGIGIGALAIAAAPIAFGSPAGASPAKHTHPLAVSIGARHRWVLANGTSTSLIAVRLSHGFRGASGSVTLTSADTPSGGGSCGTLAASSGTTKHNGIFATKYTSSSVVGFCTITATSGTASASVTIDQINPTLYAAKTHYRVHASASVNHIAANGTSTSTITFTVTDGVTPVAGDALLASAAALPHRACGSLALGAATTDASGQITATYTSSTSRGICLLWATEAATGHTSNPVAIRQTH
jgi:hypothetical protein